MSTILLISGPNLELLGEREPEIYGTATLAELVELASSTAAEKGHQLEHFSSNNEGEILNTIAEARSRCSAIIINPGALTHYAWSLHDALAAFGGVVIELHLSNPKSRESWRHTSVVAPVASGVIAGFGPEGYRLAVEAASSLIS